MSLTFYTPAPMLADEDRRETAVLESGLLCSDLAFELGGIVHQARFALATTMGAITLLIGNRQILVAKEGIGNSGHSSRARSFCGHAIAAPQSVMCVPDARKEDRFAGNPTVTEEPHIRFYAAAPLVSSSGIALGTLCVLDSAPRSGLRFGEEQELRRLAARVMTIARRGGGPDRISAAAHLPLAAGSGSR